MSQNFQSSSIFATYENKNRRFYPIAGDSRGQIRENRKRFYFPDGLPMIPEFGDSFRQMRTQFSFIGDIDCSFYSVPSPIIAYGRKAIWKPHSKRGENCDSFLKLLAKCAKQGNDLVYMDLIKASLAYKIEAASSLKTETSSQSKCLE